MELRHLRYFLAVADAEHFRRASEALHISQPTLSLQVQQLEKELGAALFDRIGRRVRLTPAGSLFREHARRVLRELEEAQAGLDELEGLKRGKLAVGALQTANAELIPAAVAEFAASHPKVVLRIDELSAPAIESGIAEGGLDLGISFLPPADDRLEGELLFEEELVLILPAGHPRAKRGEVEVRDLADEPLILLPSEFATRRMIDEAFRCAGIAPSVAAEMNTIGAILATVRRGGRGTILPATAIAGGGEGLRPVRLARPTPNRRVGLIIRKGAYPLRAREVFAGILRRLAKGEMGC